MEKRKKQTNKQIDVMLQILGNLKKWTSVLQNLNSCIVKNP